MEITINPSKWHWDKVGMVIFVMFGAWYLTHCGTMFLACTASDELCETVLLGK